MLDVDKTMESENYSNKQHKKQWQACNMYQTLTSK